MTPGFTGADIENLVKIAIREALFKGKYTAFLPPCREHATMDDFESARDRILMGLERRTLVLSDREQIKTAIHEAGHALAVYYTRGCKSLYKVTIVPRGASLGSVPPSLRLRHTMSQRRAKSSASPKRAWWTRSASALRAM